MKKEELISYLDDYLRVSEFDDASKNGLQVDTNKKEINKIGYSVDATTYVFEKAKQESVDLILCHHGIFWGQEEVLTDIPYKRTSELIKNDIALYASHLPLDAHREVGNNAGLVQAFTRIFGITEYELKAFGEYYGQFIGFGLHFSGAIHISNIITPFAETMQLEKKLYNFGGKEMISSLAFVSGSGGSALKEAKEKNYDIFITGELKHSDICLARELGLSVLLGGHRETEKIGVKLLAYHLKEKFGIELVFLDEKY